MTTQYRLQWLAAARPPAHPNSMTGTQVFNSFERVVAFVEGLASDSEVMSLTEIQTTEIDATDKLMGSLTNAE